MTEYAKLVLAEATCHTIEIREKATGKEGIANTCAEGVELFYGADDGSDDKTVSAEEFSCDVFFNLCICINIDGISELRRVRLTGSNRTVPGTMICKLLKRNSDLSVTTTFDSISAETRIRVIPSGKSVYPFSHSSRGCLYNIRHDLINAEFCSVCCVPPVFAVHGNVEIDFNVGIAPVVQETVTRTEPTSSLQTE